jgi:putative transposase
MPQSYAGAFYHFIFSTMNWNRQIDDELAPLLYDYIGGVFIEHRGILLAAGGMEDHIHLLATIPRDISLSDMMRFTKTLSSRWIRRNFFHHRDFQWQTGYGVFTVSPSHLPRVKRYIATQKEHHAGMTFQEEFTIFLKAYGIPFDERTVWD